MKVADVLQRFYAYLLTEKRVSANSFSAYKSDIAQLLAFLHMQKVELEAINQTHIKQFLHHLHTHNVGARSVARKLCSYRLLFSYLHEYANIINPMEEMHAPKFGKFLPRSLGEHDIKELFAVVEQDASPLGFRNKIMLYLLYGTGMRISELIGLKIADIHFDTGFITITGKGNKVRMVPLPQAVLEILREYLTKIHPILISDTKKTGVEFLFPVIYGGMVKAITRQACWMIFKNLWRKTNIKQSISPHQFRHSLATHLLQNGADLRSLQLMLGHETITTVQVYTHVEVKNLRNMYDKKHPRSK